MTGVASVNGLPTTRALMDASVEGLITDYPDRLRDVMAERSLKPPQAVLPGTRRELTGSEIYGRPFPL